ncbi:unnamed protein product [Prorocentrum cordatum]|uniref:Uncharacterized protein n=1 Tax=Prorocentrum cordatum TaxID=2364126 RepID=A0ABN9UU82_9DINO|nr:unnamed protein product [Polarella glacialis]
MVAMKASPSGAKLSQDVQVGLQKARETHLAEYDANVEVHCCTACGCFAKEVMKDLAKPCSGILKQSGTKKVARIRRATQPGSSAWAQAYTRPRPKTLANKKLELRWLQGRHLRA